MQVSIPDCLCNSVVALAAGVHEGKYLLPSAVKEHVDELFHCQEQMSTRQDPCNHWGSLEIPWLADLPIDFLGNTCRGKGSLAGC
jgi:hypothetical protein